MITSADTEALAREFYRAYSDGDFAALERVMAPEFRTRYQDYPDACGRDAVLADARDYKRRFPDLRFVVHEVVASPDGVACWVEMSFRHTSEYLGAPPSGRVLRAACIDFFRVEDGHLVSRRHLKDKNALTKQVR